jgi:hypothetical protein
VLIHAIAEFDGIGRIASRPRIRSSFPDSLIEAYV